MACSTCKQKGSSKTPRTKEEIEKMVTKYEKGAHVIIILWSLFAVYGIYNLITKFI
jgi:hypothetical protein